MQFFDKRTPALPHVTADEVSRAFAEYREELEWLAMFLTADHELAEACVVDARALATTQNQVFAEWLVHWARRATICSAAGMQQSRISQLAAAYQRHPCPHGGHGALSSEVCEFLKTQAPVLLHKLDALCRFALVLHGVEHYSISESALLLGVSRIAVDAAYCAALDFLQTRSCEAVAELDPAWADS